MLAWQKCTCQQQRSICLLWLAAALTASAGLNVSLPAIVGKQLEAMSTRESQPKDILVTRWVVAIFSNLWGHSKERLEEAQTMSAAKANVSLRSMSGVREPLSLAIPHLQSGARIDSVRSSQSLAADALGLSIARVVDSFRTTQDDAAKIGHEDGTRRTFVLKVDYAKLIRIAGADKRLVVSWTTGGPKRWSLAHNLGLSIRRNVPKLERKFVFIALDKDAVTRAEAAGFHAVLNEDSKDMKDDIWKMRWLIQTTCIALGLEVLVVDSDIVFLSDPFAHFHFDADLEAMTDHFFPEKHLLATWLRPAEHINTGFIFARPSNRLLEFLIEFIDRHYYSWEGLTERDGMDQRVFNKFVLMKFETEPPEVIALYGNLTFKELDWQASPKRFRPRNEWRVTRGSGARPVAVRLLDPVCISHGMNYFWRKAYKLGHHCGTLLHSTSTGSTEPAPPAVVHVNGVDPKLYFLRDRNLWYIDDWDERWAEGENDPFFLVYRHPQNMSLKDDFEHLIAGLELAAYFRRRLVLPETMNCANCPAYDVYRLNETMRGESGCTYDYFAHANGLYEVYSRVKPYAVEAGIGREPRFKQLLSKSSFDLPSLEEMQVTGALRAEILAVQQTPRRPVFGEYRVLVLAADNATTLRNALRSGTLGLRMNAERVFSCAFQQPLIGAMACLDEPYVEEFGESAMCPSSHFEEGCGPVGICCCWPFWGWGDKLQYFTGVKWELPCNCGVTVCDRYERSTQMAGAEPEQCCRHLGSDALFPEVDPGVFYCRTDGEWHGVTAAEDSHTYTAFALTDFESGKRTAQQTFETCRRDRMLRRGDAFPEVSLRECGQRITAYLLRREAWEQLTEWWTWQFHARRSLGNASRVIVSMDIGNQTDNTGFNRGKLVHDLQQLEHIVNKYASSSGTHGHTIAQSASDALPHFRRLAIRFEEFRVGRESREAIERDFEEIRPYFNRDLYVPAIAGPPGPLLSLGSKASLLSGATAIRDHQGIIVLDDVLRPDALHVAQSWLTESTVWYRSLQDGGVLKAQVRDGLHAEFGLRVFRELRDNLGIAQLFGDQPLLDLIAYKHSDNSRGLPAHCVDGRIGALLWVTPAETSVSDPTAWNGVRVFDGRTSTNICQGIRVGPPPAAACDAEAADEIIPNRQKAQASIAETKGSKPGRSVSGNNLSALQEVSFRSNRLVLWPATRAVELVHDSTEWGRSMGYEGWRTDWLFILGKPQADMDRELEDFQPSFEGKADAWGDHYYARDHDHR